MDIKAVIASAKERIDTLTLRERGLLFAAIVVVTYTLVLVGLIHPLERQERAIQKNLVAARTQTARINHELDMLLAPKTRAQQMVRLKKLTAQVDVLKVGLAKLTAGLVSSRDMPALMHRVLAEVPGVMLVGLVNHATVPIRRTPKSPPFLYRHEMTLVVRGPYSALVRYLAILGSTKRRVLWGRVALTADHYPYSTLRLHIYTLSVGRALLR
ncbi:MAG TPA: hypothetical protein VMV40_02175 [Acidiferrobacter sp.]|nr:hypothetical protein [Acidiferrobacter sp.]